MYKIIWDVGTNGIILTDKITTNRTTPPRPVFFEELDLLGLNKYWAYPASENPLLWAVDRRYFYKGEMIAEIKGGNVFEEPQMLLTDDGKQLKLNPIDIDAVVEKNKDAIFVLENEAMDFIEHTFKIYRREQNKVDMFVASFSSGKDSQVILDLVSRIIPPDDYIVVYSDTDMELPSSIATYHKTKEIYQSLYPGLEFHLAKNEHGTLEYWKKFGAPSRMHRWCCSVTKTAPFGRLLKNIHSTGKQPVVLVFEGVRAEESTQRGQYNRIGKGVKHATNINARPILYWNLAEVYLYIFYRNLPINQGYRDGLSRVGCGVCPFSSSWSEFILKKTHPDLMDKYLQVIDEQIKGMGVKDRTTYIKEGKWKTRSGGRGLDIGNSRLDIIKQKPDFDVILTNPNENIFEWIKAIGEVIFKEENGKIFGEIKIKNEIFKFSLEQSNKTNNIKLKFIVMDSYRDPIFINKLKKIVYKTTYCIHCESCEVECPSGALSVVPAVKIDMNKCSHCGNCFNFTEKGCLMAKSISVFEGGIKMTRTSGIDKYSGFGLREKWLRGYLNNIDNWFESDNLLGSKQVPAVINWLRDAEFLNRENKEPNRIGLKLRNKVAEDFNFVWEIAWVNMYYNSVIVKWYVDEINWGDSYPKKDLLAILQNSFQNMKERTLSNALGALVNTFDESPLGSVLKIGLIEKKGKTIKLVKKKGTDTIHSISVAYALYRFAKDKSRYSFTVSDLYKKGQEGGPYKLFGISREKFANILRTLQENKNKIIWVDLVAGLDNISLREDVDYIEVLNLLMEN
ncbi:MAG: DUF4007 family protein [Candidatus Aminicenantes bacterium]|nr:DUF4007 family protein [Candidatus Aminicenantes bacterium]